MKKIFKKQLAIVLAVLMILSAWVFVAPDANKAEALTAGSYGFKWTFYMYNGSFSMDTKSTTLYCRVVTNNGRGSEKNSNSYSWSSSSVGTNSTRNFEGTTSDGFPIGVYGTVHNSNGTQGANVEMHFYVKGTSQSSYTELWKKRGDDLIGAGKDCTIQQYIDVASDKYPYAASASITSQPGDITIPESGTATTTFKATVKDQYGVIIGNSSLTRVTPTVTYTTGTSVSCTNTSDASDDTYTISCTNSAKMAGTTDSTTATAKVGYTFNGKTVYATTNSFKITDPQYTFTVNGNGGTLNSSNATKYYGDPYGSTPSAYRVGYNLKGFYDSQNADDYGFSQATPSGSQLTSVTQINSDKIYYAAWWAKNISLTFLDADGQTVGTGTGKYGKAASTNNGISWTSSGLSLSDGPAYHKKPGETGTFNYVFDGWKIVSTKAYKVTTTSTNAQSQSESYDLTGEGTSATLYGDTVFQATYTAVKNNYTVKFYNQSSTPVINKSDYTYNQTITQPSAPTKAADNTYTYAFKGWTEVTASDINSGTYAYIVNADGVTDNGEYIDIKSDFRVRNDIILVPVFEKTYINYTVTFENADPAYGNTTVTGHYGDTYEVPGHAESYTKGGYRFPFVAWQVNGSNSEPTGTITGNAAYKAKYSAGIPAVYTINFYDYDGTLLNPDNNQFDHDSQVTIPSNATGSYRDDNYEYMWTGDFIDADGNAVATIAGADKEYYAEYAKSDLYTVTYYNGTEQIATAKFTAGSTIVLPDGIETPTKEDDKYATNYVFNGTFADAEGNDISVMPAKDIAVYVQYDMDVTKYTVTFINDGDPYAEDTYHYGDTIIVPDDPEKAADDTYNYTFKGWDKAVSTKCTDNATYTAEYRKAYNYYKITWLNEDGSTYKVQNCIYNERILTPVTNPSPITTTPSSAEMTVVFDKWVYAVGTDYVRGDRITSDITLQASFTETGKACDVTFLDSTGEVLQTMTVAYGTYLKDIENVVEPVKEASGSTHYAFAGWQGVTFETERIYTDVNYVATYVEEDHDFVMTSTTTAPTFWATGEALYTCSVCKYKETRVVEKLVDETLPTSIIYIRHNSWKNVEPASFDVQTPVAGNNYVAITTGDKAAVSEYNPTGKGSGVASIDYAIVTDAAYADAPETITGWQNAYLDEDGDVVCDEQGSANARLNQLLPDGFTEGQDFVIVCKVVDKLGNTIYANTGVLVYDNTVPEVEVTSDNYSGTKHCLGVTINATDNNAVESVKVDGTALTAEADGSYKYTESGLHQVVVTDTAGNETKANFEIVGKHNTKAITIAATCTENEIVVTYCQVCAKEISRVETADSALGHDYQPYYEKAATCIAEGVKEEICSRCDDVKTTALPVDADGHVYYRAQTNKATCEAAGEKYEICKYCDYRHVIEEIPATGHTASGTWVVITEATCTAEGLQVQYCKNCDTTEIQAQEAIPALGHKLVVDSVVAPTTEAEGYTVYKCTRCDYTENKDYTDKLVQYTVTFNVEGTETAIVVNEGETVTATDAPATEKAADATYTYTFANWADAEGNEVTLPLTVTEDITLTAVFNKKGINYTITLLESAEDGAGVYYKIGYNKNGSEVDLSAYKLTKDATATATYTFAGWKLVGADDSTAALTYTIAAADVTLVPVFTETLKTFKVTFAYDYDNVITVKTVKAGEAATAPADPEKAYDDGAHYVFAGWDKDITNITADTLVLAKFTAQPHDTTTVVSVVAATCTEVGTTKYQCSCGFEYTLETAPATGHSFPAEPSENAEGVLGYTCATCGEFQKDTKTYTVKFYNEDKTTVIKTIAYQEYNADISGKIPAPTKAEDANYTYTFAGWTDVEGKPVTVETIVKANATYYASFSKAEKTYTVIFAIDASNVCAKYVVAGGESVEYTGKTPVKYVPNDYGHNVFVGWNQEATNVSSDMYILAQFERVEHNFKTSTVAATCTEAGGTKYTCKDCGYYYIQRTDLALGHEWTLTKTVDNMGYYTCSRCGETKTEEIPDTSVIAEIKIVDSKGNPVEGAKVTLYDGSTYINSGVTGSDGIVRLQVPEAKTYTIVVDKNGSSSTGTVSVGEDGKTSVSGVKIADQSCTCACHKDGVWGSIFRFFHKIIHIITGKFNCCSCPDSRYN